MDLSNEQLRPEDLPSRDDPQMAWVEFALTFDGYKAKGSFEECASFGERTKAEWEASGKLPTNLTDLRSALFMEQRSWRHGPEEPFTDQEWRYWSALVGAVRELLPT